MFQLGMQRRRFIQVLAGSFIPPPRAWHRRAYANEMPMTVAAVGDIVLGANLQIHYDHQLRNGVTRDVANTMYFRGIRSVLQSADLRLANLEFVFTERGKRIPKNFNFRARPELVDILKHGGIDIVTLANNHTMDYGTTGLRDTLLTLDKAGVARFGAGLNSLEARAPAVLERRGLRIGFLGYYFQDAADMLEPRRLYATRHGAGVAGCYIDLDCVRQQVAEDVQRVAGSVHALITYFHWGQEGSTRVRDYQIDLAHLCIDLGCKAVLGAHPHVLQGVELYREAPIFYSLGNFVYGGAKEPGDKLSVIALLKLTQTGVTSTDLVPVQVTRWPEAPFQPFVLGDVEREGALKRIAALSRDFRETLPVLRPYLEDGNPEVSPKGTHEG